MNDVINGLGGAFALLLHARRLYIDKQIRGASALSFVFFTIWGWFNVFWFYPSVNCWCSFAGGVAVAIVNTAYLGMPWWYRKN